MTDKLLTIALSKGRIFEETLPLLAAAGIVPAEEPEKSRKLCRLMCNMVRRTSALPVRTC